MFSLMWSEHCGYKHSRRLLKTLPVEGGRARARPGRERGRRGGRRPRGRVQGRVAQPPERGRAVPGRRDRGRRHPARRLRDRRAADRHPGFAALRRARRSPRSRYLLEHAVAGIGHYGNSIGVADGRRRGLLRVGLRAELPDQRDVRRADRARAADPLGRRGSGQRRGAVRRAHRPRRHRRRLGAGERGARRGRRGEAPDGPDRRPVRGEEAARVLAGAARARAARRAPGPRRGRADLVVVGDGGEGRPRDRPRRAARAAARG